MPSTVARIISIGASIMASSAAIQSSRVHLRKSPGIGPIGVVEQDVGLGAGRQRRRASLRGRDVGHDRRHPDAGRIANFGGGTLQHVAGARHDGDMHAFLGDASAQALPSPRLAPHSSALPIAYAEIHGALTL